MSTELASLIDTTLAELKGGGMAQQLLRMAKAAEARGETARARVLYESAVGKPQPAAAELSAARFRDGKESARRVCASAASRPVDRFAELVKAVPRCMVGGLDLRGQHKTPADLAFYAQHTLDLHEEGDYPLLPGEVRAVKRFIAQATK